MLAHRIRKLSTTVDRLVDMVRFFEQDEAGGGRMAERFRTYHRACTSDSAPPPCALHCNAALV